jgi:hypothetical protein
VGASFVTKASIWPLCVVSNAPGVVGKFVERVSPVTCALPPASTATPTKPASSLLPPRNVE